MRHAVKVLPLVMGLALVAGNVQAMGLGTLEVKSQLNQPLIAEIPLLGVTPEVLDALRVRLASPEAFERVGLPRPAGTTANLQFSVGRNARGEPVVRVTTPGRVEDPFVSFLLEAEWSKGSVVREFTALIDPPHIAAVTVTPMAAPTVLAAAVPVTPPAPAPAPTPIEPSPFAGEGPVIAESPPAEPARPPTSAPVPISGARVENREVRGGETLWSIAQQNRQGATVAQMMLAIQRANPDAFLRENINLLRKGAVLRIPTGQEAIDFGREAAEAQVREQMQAWRATRPTPAQVPAEAASVAPPPIVATRTASAAATPTADARLEIAPPTGAGVVDVQSGAAVDGSGRELRAELGQAREDLSAREAELRELRSRLTEQESLANEQKRLIELKDSQLSALEEALRQQRIDDVATAATPVQEPAALPSAPAAVVESALPQVDAKLPWFRNPALLGGAGLLLLAGLVALLLRRRHRTEVKRPLPMTSTVVEVDPEQEERLPTTMLSAEVVAMPESIPEPEVAPSSPHDLDAYLAQMRRHYNAGDAEAFLRTAERMSSWVDEPSDPRWREVVVMGMGLVPGHALFRELQWNPIHPDGVHSRASALEPAPIPEETPVDADSNVDAVIEFSERETAERPVLDLAPAVDDAGLDDTRLELAKAYIEIGDADGARGMLEEVLAEGSSAARAEAEQLLKQLG